MVRPDGSHQVVDDGELILSFEYYNDKGEVIGGYTLRTRIWEPSVVEPHHMQRHLSI